MLSETLIKRRNISLFLERFDTGFYLYKDGRIYQTRRRLNQFKEVVLSTPEIASLPTKRGYRRVGLKREGQMIYAYEHRVIFAYHNGIDELFSHECIDHINGDKGDNRIENLRGLSIKENTAHAENMGLYMRTYGKINGMCRLSSDDVTKIRNLYKNPYNQYELADLYDVSQSHISEIVTFKKRKYA